MLKAHLVQAMQNYENKRSLWNAGFFLYVTDFFNPVTKLYYELRKFIQSDLEGLKLTDELSKHHLMKLKYILRENQTTPNSTNTAVVDLYNEIHSYLIPSETPSSRF